MDITVSDEVSQEYHALVKNILCNREFLKLSLYSHHQWTTRLMHSINVSYLSWDGLVKLLRIDSLKHGISVKITDDNKIRLNFHVIVAYGVNISTIADNLVNNVKYKVEAFTGMEIEKINIMVEGVRAID